LVHTEKNRISIIPTQKYGRAEVTTNSGGTMLSTFPPRFQPAIVPIRVPPRKASTVATPTRPRVHGTACAIWLPTDSGK
jgi:hypothetical protein